MTPQMKIPPFHRKEEKTKIKKEISIIFFVQKYTKNEHHPWTRGKRLVCTNPIRQEGIFHIFPCILQLIASFHWDKEILRACRRQAEIAL